MIRNENKLITIYLEINEARCNESACTVMYLACNNFFIKKYLFWINDFAIPNPQVILFYGMIPKDTAISELVNGFMIHSISITTERLKFSWTITDS